MILWQVGVGALLGAALCYGGALVAPRWTSKPPAPWESYTVAAVGALLAGLLASSHGLSNYFWQHLIFLGILVTASLVDLHDKIIPNELVLVGLAVGIAMLFVIPYPGKDWKSGLEGAAAGFAVLLALALLVKGGMGLGDVKLAGVIGLFLGLQWVAMGLIFAFLAGGLAGALMLLFKLVKRKSHIPFGPYLAFGAALTVLYGLPIWNWYIGY